MVASIKNSRGESDQNLQFEGKKNRQCYKLEEGKIRISVSSLFPIGQARPFRNLSTAPEVYKVHKQILSVLSTKVQALNVTKNTNTLVQYWIKCT